LSFGAQQRAFDRFRTEYNEERPHEALGQEVPASLYRPSLRSYPRQLPEQEYPTHFDGRWRVHFGWVPIGILDLRRAAERNHRNFGTLVPIVDPALHRRRRRGYGS
jgi:hypothetical protein